MATTTIETVIANPARKGKRKNMARKLSAKQIKAGFGGKRRQNSLKTKRKKAPKRRTAAKKHRRRTNPGQARKVITGYGSTVMNRARKRKRNASASGKTNVVFNKAKRRRKNGAKRRASKRKNPGAIYALVNPARKGSKRKMARRTKKRQRKNPAGTTRRRRTTKRVGHRRRSNPSTFGKPMDWLSLGGGSVVGAIGATSLPNMLLGSSNQGAVGYLGMAAATGILAVGTHMVFKRNTMAVAGVIAGGAGAIIRRIIQDYSPVGSYLNSLTSGSGMGDYITNWNFTTPQIIGGGNGNNALGTAGTLPVSVAGAPGTGRALMNV